MSYFENCGFKFQLLAMYLLAGNYLLAGDTTGIKPKALSFFNYLKFAAGVNMNQGSSGLRYFEVNYRTMYRVNLNLVSYKNFDLNCSANYLKKSLVGDLYNASRKNFFFRKMVDSDYYPNRPKYNFDIVYYSFDLRSKVTFFKRKKLQPFLEFGIRENILISHNYNTNERSSEIDEFIEPNLKKYFLNCTYSIGLSYKFSKVNSALLVDIEINNDRKYFTDWKYGRAAYLSRFFEQFNGGKFQCMLFRIGFRHYF